MEVEPNGKSEVLGCLCVCESIGVLRRDTKTLVSHLTMRGFVRRSSECFTELSDSLRRHTFFNKRIFLAESQVELYKDKF